MDIVVQYFRAPMLDACINIALTMASSVTAALACSGMMRPEHLRRVVLMYGLFFVTLPTIMFFRDYLTANMLVVLSMYNIMHLHRQGMEKGHIFFASFFVVIALWFVPSAAVFILPVYLGILIFTPGDIRSWFIPLAGARSFLHSDDHLRFRILRRFGFSARHILQVVFDAVHRKSVQSRKLLFLRRRISLGIGICVYKILEHGSKRYSPPEKNVPYRIVHAGRSDTYGGSTAAIQIPHNIFLHAIRSGYDRIFRRKRRRKRYYQMVSDYIGRFQPVFFQMN